MIFYAKTIPGFLAKKSQGQKNMLFWHFHDKDHTSQRVNLSWLKFLQFQVVSKNFMFLFNPLSTQVWLTLVGMLCITVVTMISIDLVTMKMTSQFIKSSWLQVPYEAAFRVLSIFVSQGELCSPEKATCCGCCSICITLQQETHVLWAHFGWYIWDFLIILPLQQETPPLCTHWKALQLLSGEDKTEAVRHAIPPVALQRSCWEASWECITLLDAKLEMKSASCLPIVPKKDFRFFHFGVQHFHQGKALNKLLQVGITGMTVSRLGMSNLVTSPMRFCRNSVLIHLLLPCTLSPMNRWKVIAL